MKGTGVFLPRSYEDVIAANRSESQRSSSFVDVTASSTNTNRVLRKVSTEPSKRPSSSSDLRQGAIMAHQQGASSRGTSNVSSKAQISPSSSSNGSSPRYLTSSSSKSSTPISSRSAQHVPVATARQQRDLQGMRPAGNRITYNSEPPPPPPPPVFTGRGSDMAGVVQRGSLSLVAPADVCTSSLLTGQTPFLSPAAARAPESQQTGTPGVVQQQQQQQWAGPFERGAPVQVQSAPVPALGAIQQHHMHQQQQAMMLHPASPGGTMPPAGTAGSSVEHTVHTLAALRQRLAAGRLPAASAAAWDLDAGPDAGCGTFSTPDTFLQQQQAWQQKQPLQKQQLQQLLPVSATGAVYHSESLPISIRASLPGQHSAPLFGLQQSQMGLSNSLGGDSSFYSPFGNSPNACGLLGGSLGASPAVVGGPRNTLATTVESDSGFALFTADSNLDSAGLALSMQGMQAFSCSPMATLGSFDLRSVGSFGSAATPGAQIGTAALAPAAAGGVTEVGGLMGTHGSGEGLQLQGLSFPAVCAGMNAGTACLDIAAGAQHAQHAQHDDLAALAAVAAQQKLQQMVALEALQSQLRQDVVNLLPLI